MKAWFFAALTTTLFTLSVLAELYATYMGIGLPTSFTALYTLESYELQTELGRQVGKPVVYEWVTSTILQPGETLVEVGFPMRPGAEGSYNVTITVAIGSQVYEGNGTWLRFTTYRNEVFLVMRIRIVIHTEGNGMIPRDNLVLVTVKSAGR